MPRVQTRKKNNAGKARTCGRAGCGREIKPGESYYLFEFRYGGKHFRCRDHYPRQSELTQSKMSAVYSAIEAAEEALPAADSCDDVRGEVEQVAEAVREVADEYRAADEEFGGQGATEHAERADELEAWADELDGFEPDVEQPQVDEEALEDKMRADGFTEADEAEWTSVRQERYDEAEEALDDAEALEQAREQALEAIGGCPL